MKNKILKYYHPNFSPDVYLHGAVNRYLKESIEEEARVIIEKSKSFLKNIADNIKGRISAITDPVAMPIFNLSGESIVAKPGVGDEPIIIPSKKYIVWAATDGVVSKGNVYKCSDLNVTIIDADGDVSCYPLGATKLESPPDDSWEKYFKIGSGQSTEDLKQSGSNRQEESRHGKDYLEGRVIFEGDINVEDSDISNTA